MIRNKQVAKAVVFSNRNPHAKLSEVAEKFGIRVAQLYSARYNHGKTNAPTMHTSKKRAVVLMTSAAALKDRLIPDMVNHPPHYKAGGIETIDFIEAKNLGYNLGNVVKYVTRAHHKGALLEDLKKAQWYLNREVGKLEEK